MYMRAHPDADEIKLLLDIARGLEYVHGQGVIYGNLRTVRLCFRFIVDFFNLILF